MGGAGRGWDGRGREGKMMGGAGRGWDGRGREGKMMGGAGRGWDGMEVFWNKYNTATFTVSD